MPTEIAASTIAQQAFLFLELSPISSFSDDSPQALAAQTAYPIAKKNVLESYDWSFARVLALLSPVTLPDTVAVDSALPYAYSLPGDLLRLQWVEPCVTWRREGNRLRADKEGSLLIRYTRNLDTEAQLPGMVHTAMALQLALLLAPKWLQSRTKRADLRSDYIEALQGAKDEDVLSGSETRWTDSPETGDWATEAVR